ncbi:alfa-L-rhamnosidase, partial [Nakamurella silvestris]
MAAFSMAGTATAELAAAATTVTALEANSLANPLGITGTDPLLSWQLTADRRGTTQSAYEIHVGSSPAGVASGDVWNSGKVTSAQSLDVAYGGPDLTAATRYYWSVRVWDDQGTATDWASSAWFETGLLSPSAWTGSFIGDSNAASAKWLNYTVEFNATVKGALGVYFRAKDSSNAYMWQFNQNSNNLRPHTKVNGNFAVVSPTPTMPAGFDWTKSHKFSVTVDGTTITTKVDDVVLDTRTSSTLGTPGYVGFRTSASENESAVVRDLKVTSKDGTVLVNTAFPSTDATFTGGTVTAGGLSVSGNTELWQTQASSMPVLRKDFATTSGKTVASARVYATALGAYKLFLNGKRVGDQEMAPGWTDYRIRVQTQAYDVTDLLSSGANTVGAELAKGWYGGNLGPYGTPDRYGTNPRLLAELHVTYTDGTTQVIKTDNTWTTTKGPIIASDMFNGETYDNQRALALAGWDKPGYAAAEWSPAVVDSAAYLTKLEPQTDQPVRITQQLPAKTVTEASPGAYVYDLGQNMVGVAKLKLTGTAGQTVRIRYAEVLNPDGTVYTANLRSAKATDYYTFGTTGTETYVPNFTFHGFRYVEITGVTSAPPLDAVTGEVMGTDLDFTSTLDTSSSLVNQLQSNITWGQRGNFLSIPTDTPARDERLGWTGDINVFSRTASYNMDTQSFLSKWLQDLRDAQLANGSYTSVAPTVPNNFDGGNGDSGWADAGVNVPWQIWQAYGDTTLINEHYASMKKFVDYLTSTAAAGIRQGGQYNDWLNLDDNTPSDLIGTAFYAKDARQLSQMAAAIGKTADATAYENLYNSVKAAFQTKFVKADGTVGSDSQTSYILALTNDLVPAATADAVATKFAATITRRDVHLSTGFLGVDGLLPALTKIGRTDLAYRLLQNTDYPSWGYEIGKGATTIWERWNSIDPVTGAFGDVGMNSFNHYAYGAVGEWMYETMAGVSAAQPGYKKSLIAPQPGAGIDHVDFSHDTRYGEVTSNWAKDGDNFDLDITVPANTTATVVIPAANIASVTESGTAVTAAPGVTGVTDTGATVTAEVTAGTYSFTVDAASGKLGEAAEKSADLAALVTSLEGSSAISGTQANHLRATVATVDTKISAALAGVGTNDSAALAAIDQALVAIAAEVSWINGAGGVPTGPAGQLVTALGSVNTLLTAAAIEVLDLSAQVVLPTESVVPGSTTTVKVSVVNAGGLALTGVRDTLVGADQWTVTPAQSTATPIPAGGDVTFSHTVKLSADAAVGSVPFTGSVTVPIGTSTITVPLSSALVVSSPISITAAAITPATSPVGTNAMLTATVHNSGAFPITGSLGATVPTGWAAPLRSNPVVVAPGADATVTIPLPISLDATTNGIATLKATFALGSVVYDSKSVAVTQTFDTSVAGAIDHVDLGEATSEAAHNVVGSASSGTNTEAGLTRRYADNRVSSAWFQFDLAIVPNKPVLVRMIETFDMPNIKNYDIMVNGSIYKPHYYQRTDAGMGTTTYQVLIDDPALLTGNKITVRLQYNGKNS